MFTRIKLKNYKSLVKLDVNLLQKRDTPKKMVVVYGENGVGKSNFASVFHTLCESILTLSVRKALKVFLEEKKDMAPTEDVIRAINRNFRNTEGIINECKTIGSTDNMLMEFEFIIDGRKGDYLIEYDDNKIVREKLEYVLKKNKVVFFDISEKEKRINKGVFVDLGYEKVFRELLNQYSGIHSFLSILNSEHEDKASDYIKERISERLYEVIATFMSMSVKVKSGNFGERGKRSVPSKILTNLGGGEILESEIPELEKAGVLLNEFFTQTYSDIKQAYYKTQKNDNVIRYRLFLKKNIYGKLVDIDFARESTGTMQLLEILPFLLMSMSGQVVVIDELDTGIHDLLVNNILLNVVPEIKGQLIITTHNTMIMESEMDPQFLYTFYVDRNANKELRPIIDFEERSHPNLNYRNRYLRGMYGGVPYTGDIDFEELNSIIE